MLAWPVMFAPLLLLLLATAVRGDDVHLLNDIPVGTVMDEGSTFVLLWDWDGDATGVGKLNMYSFSASSLDDSVTYVLEENLNLTTGRYPWTVKAPEGRDTLDWYCRLGISYNDDFSTTSGRSFMIKALPQTSTTSSSSTTSTTPTSSTSTTSTFTQTPPSTSGAPGLKGGVLAGLIVGVIVAVGGLIAVVAIVVYYRRKKSRGENNSGNKNGKDDGSSSALGDAGTARGGQEQYQKPELDASGTERAVYELDGAQRAQEVDAVAKPTELDSNVRSELAGDGERIGT